MNDLHIACTPGCKTFKAAGTKPFISSSEERLSVGKAFSSCP